MNTINYNSSRIAVPTNDGIEIYDTSEILRCEADKTSSFIHLADGTQVASTKSLKHFESILGSCDFLRVHKGNLINIYHIRKYLKGKKSAVILTDSSCVEVASRKKNQLLKIISSFPQSVRQPQSGQLNSEDNHDKTAGLTEPVEKARKVKDAAMPEAKRKLSKAS